MEKETGTVRKNAPFQLTRSDGSDNKDAGTTANKSVIPSLSLPKGGGAIHGIGEKFSTNPVTGTGSMSVPVFTTPGRSGFGPQLSLSYDSGAGNGIFGFGWSISLPFITRKTDKGLPRYRDAEESDVFILSGAEDLVPVTDVPGNATYAIRKYRPRTEGLFARIERWTHTQTGDVHWRSISKDNITTIYGKDGTSRIVDPDDNKRIFSWLICLSYDDKGNAIFYEYKNDNSTGVDRTRVHEKNRTDDIRSTNRYLKYIRYGNKTRYDRSGDLSLRDDWSFTVAFDYGEHDANKPTTQQISDWVVRKDPFSSYRSGFEVRTYRLCQRILVFHHFPDELKDQDYPVQDYLVRSMDFIYEESPVASFIKSITQSGYVLKNGAYTKKSLPPLEFGYSRAEIHDVIEVADAESLRNLPIGLDGFQYQFADLDSEGISGILMEQGDAWFYKPNLGGGRFDEMETIPSRPATANLAGGRQQLMDLAGDGQLDLVEFSGPVSGFYERTPDGTWDPFRPFASLPNIPWNNPNLKFVDLNGDGHADILVAEGESFSWYPSLAESGFSALERVYLPIDEELGPRLVFADGTQSVYLADLSGDGLSDLVRIRNGEICYWPNLGYGKFGAKVTMYNSPVFDTPDLFDQKRIRLVDTDGSGTTDILYLRHDRVDMYLNQSGNRWSTPKLITQFPQIDDLSSVMTADLFGNGTGCLVWSSPLPGMAARQMSYIRLMGMQKPHLLISMKNNMGAETVVTYTSSTEFYLADKVAGTPWVTRLPFPVHVVSRVDTYDRISRNLFVTRYTYHDGYFDGIEREFRGFGMVEQIDTEEYTALSGNDTFPDVPQASNIDAASHVPPVVTKTWYHTGAYLDSSQISTHFIHEYYREPGLSDDQRDALLLPDTVLPSGLNVQEEREACRALRGSILRQEIYALDGPPKEDHPYSVSERNYTIRCLQPWGENRHAVFFVHPRETIDYHYERNPADPRISHAITFEVDPYGNVLKSAAIGYGRKAEDPELAGYNPEKQTKTLVTYTENSVTINIDKSDDYRTPLPAETRTYELTGLSDLRRRLVFLDIVQISNDTVQLQNFSEILYEQSATSGTQRRLIEDVRTIYRKNDLTGFLPLGILESLALPGETYKLAFTPGLLTNIYLRQLDPAISPEDLLPDRIAMLGTEGGYIRSQDHRNLGLFPLNDPDDHWWIPSGKIYYWPDKSDDAGKERDFAKEHFYLPHRFDDPFGKKTLVCYDTDDVAPKKKNYNLLIVRTEDPVGNIVTAQNDYRVMQPSSITDPNGTISDAKFDALGLVVATAIHKGNQGDSIKDVQADLLPPDYDTLFDNPKGLAETRIGTATSYIIYDIDCYHLTGNPEKPPYAATIVRETHVSDPIPVGGRKYQVSFSYSDGFGREIQKKIQAEPGPVNGIQSDSRWVGSGWTIYNNKGKPVRQYEPFFDTTHNFRFRRLEGVSPVLFYDPVGRVVATLHPNNTYEKVVFDPWQQKTYDVNDMVAMDPRDDPDILGYVKPYFKQVAPQRDDWKTWIWQRGVDPANPPMDSADPEIKSAIRTLKHADTPTTAYFDTLGRTFLTFAYNRYQRDGTPLPPIVDEIISTIVLFDIEGNQREVIDALGRTVMVYDYDMLSNRIKQNSMDAGTRWMLNDVTGNPVYGWDSMSRTIRHQYDDLRRQTHLLVTEKATSGNDVTFLAERTVYGEDHPDSGELNLRRKVFLMLDGAGMVVNCAKNPRRARDTREPENESYDFKGNLLRSSRRLWSDYKVTPNWKDFETTLRTAVQQLDNAKPVDEFHSQLSVVGFPLESEIFTGTTLYDALNRPIQSIAPHSSNDGTKLNVTQPVYNDANLLECVDVWLKRDAEPAGLLVFDSSKPDPAYHQIVQNIDYNAKGQREFIEYGNNVKTQYDYDPLTFRLTNLFTTRGPGFTLTDCPNTPACSNPPKSCPKPRQNPCSVQNLRYTYDPVGNIIHIRDDAQQTIYFSGTIIPPRSEYNYDSTYRLIEAKGREHKGTSVNPWPSWNDAERMFRQDTCDPNLMLNYTESYFYDLAGNIEHIDHHGANNGDKIDWIRTLMTYDPNDPAKKKINNRLQLCSVNGQSARYHYDAHGNIVSMPPFNIENSENTLPGPWPMVWDYKDQLHSVVKSKKLDSDPNGCAGCIIYFTYDVGGQRVRKVMKQDGKRFHERIYIGGFEIFRDYKKDGSKETLLERESLHVMDDKQRVALIDIKMIDKRPNATAVPETLTRYQFGNHLGSAALELDEGGQKISYEEYYPYGGTSYQAVLSSMPGGIEVSRKRYRYTGKERDEETGLYYHGARYYAPWLGRWCNADPSPRFNSGSRYEYVKQNPVKLFDPNGMAEQPSTLETGTYTVVASWIGSVRLITTMADPLAIVPMVLIGKYASYISDTKKAKQLIKSGEFNRALAVQAGYSDYFDIHREGSQAGSKVSEQAAVMAGHATGFNQAIETITGETRQGTTLSGWERASTGLDAASRLVNTATTVLGGVSLARSVQLPSMSKPVKPASQPRIIVPEGSPAPIESPTHATIPPRNANESDMDYGNRLHYQEFERIVSVTNPGAAGPVNPRGLPGPDKPPNTSRINASYGELKSSKTPQSKITGQARGKWNLDPSTAHYWFYDESRLICTEGVIQTDKNPRTGKFIR